MLLWNKKKIKEKEYYYHRITINGKRKEYYVAFDEVPELGAQIDKRKALEKQLKELKRFIVPEEEVNLMSKRTEKQSKIHFCNYQDKFF